MQLEKIEFIELWINLVLQGYRKEANILVEIDIIENQGLNFMYLTIFILNNT